MPISNVAFAIRDGTVENSEALALSLKRPLSERFQAVAGEEKERKEVEEAYITRGAGQLGRLSNGGISTIPNNQE